jgi:hypothetical protein
LQKGDVEDECFAQVGVMGGPVVSSAGDRFRTALSLVAGQLQADGVGCRSSFLYKQARTDVPGFNFFG